MDEQNRADMLENGEKSFLNVPLVYEGRPIGFLVFIETEVERHFTDEERQLAAALGEQAAAAIHHAQLLRQTETQNRQLGLLLESTRAISSSVDLDEVLNTVARTAGELLGSEECQIQEYDAAGNTVTPVALWQRTPTRSRARASGRCSRWTTSRRSARSSRPAKCWSSATPTRTCRRRRGRCSTSTATAPTSTCRSCSTGSRWACSSWSRRTQERHWTPDEVALATALAEQAAVAIEHARLYKRVQDQAVTDGLTGLYNHRHFYERLEHEIARARRYGTPGLAADDRPRRLQGVQRPQRPPRR